MNALPPIIHRIYGPEGAYLLAAGLVLAAFLAAAVVFLGVRLLRLDEE